SQIFIHLIGSRSHNLSNIVSTSMLVISNVIVSPLVNSIVTLYIVGSIIPFPPIPLPTLLNSSPYLVSNLLTLHPSLSVRLFALTDQYDSSCPIFSRVLI